MDCSCSTCQSACKHKPGWFKPGEAEKAAELLGVSLKELFDSSLMADWWEDDENIFLLSPRTTRGSGGEMAEANSTGKCVFFTEDGLCRIHKVKPFECQSYDHTKEYKDVSKAHKEAGLSWKGHQEQVKELYGSEPEAEDYSLTDSLFW